MYYAVLYPMTQNTNETRRAMSVFPSKEDWERARKTSSDLGEKPAEWLELEYIDFVGPQGEPTC